MTTFRIQAAQGDTLLNRIEKLPDGLTEQEPTDGVHIVAHSETGHHHTVSAAEARFYADPNSEFVCYLVCEADLTRLEHHRSNDTHKPVSIKKGIYEVRRQREWSPYGGERRVQD